MNISEIKPKELSLIEPWWEHDQTPHYEQPKASTLKIQNRHTFLAWQEQKPIALLETEFTKTCTYIGIVIEPEVRNCGRGKKVLWEFMQLKIFADTKKFVAGIDPQNKISQRLFESMGFTYETTDKDGILDYVWIK